MSPAPTLEQILDGGHIDWRREHVGIPYEISYWGHGRMNPVAGIWNFYLTLREGQFPEGVFEKHIALEPRYERWSENSPLREVHDYYVWPFTEFEHFNGGITFYNLNGIAPDRWAKVGCDYNHSWDADRGYPYDLNWIDQDAKRQCEQLRELVPGIKWWSTWDGKYYDTEGEAKRKPEAMK